MIAMDRASYRPRRQVSVVTGIISIAPTRNYFGVGKSLIIFDTGIFKHYFIRIIIVGYVCLFDP